MGIIIIIIIFLLLLKIHGSVSRVTSAVVVMFCFSHPFEKSINVVPVSFLIFRTFILSSYFDGSKMKRICFLALFSDGT